MSPTKSAYQVLKKENEKQKNLFFGVKFEGIPRIKNVEGNLAWIGIKVITKDLHLNASLISLIYCSQMMKIII
jgi:hypothetical protein